ncbi:hypothetical protein [Thalassospira marina]|uniref:hypothetical protein n=1 Tax=Thalassospira marina TaxID=2048283 RepID=UPI0012FE9D0C|nr:hypothetical protein [Thalassospira marina]
MSFVKTKSVESPARRGAKRFGKVSLPFRAGWIGLLGLFGSLRGLEKRLTLPDTTEGGFIPDDLKILHFVGLAGLAWSKNSPKALKKFDRIVDFCRTRNQSGNVLEFWQAAR